MNIINIVSHVCVDKQVIARPERRVDLTNSPLEPFTSQQADQPGSRGERILFRTMDSASATPVMVPPYQREEPARGLMRREQVVPGSSERAEGDSKGSPPRPGPSEHGDLRSTLSSFPWFRGPGSPGRGSPHNNSPPVPSNTPVAGGYHSAVMTDWGDLRDPAVQECFMHLPMDTFHMELRKMPYSWAWMDGWIQCSAPICPQERDAPGDWAS